MGLLIIRESGVPKRHLKIVKKLILNKLIKMYCLMNKILHEILSYFRNINPEI